METEAKTQHPDCHYCKYDPATLEPINEITAKRLSESQLLETQFAGKTVLYIGCNLGLFFLLEAQRGAARVIGIDVTAEFIDQSERAKAIFLDHACASEEINIEFQKIDFMALNEAHASNIVLCYEVLHWLAAEGQHLDVCIQKLRSLTQSELLLEFTWDVAEQSLKGRGLSHDVYNAEIIFRELLKHFQHVRILRFTENMNDPRAKRILVHASDS